MLEIRYDDVTKVVTAWRANEKRFGNLDRGRAETIVILDIPIPERTCLAYLYDEVNKALVDNPDYIEPIPARDLVAEIDDIKARVEKLEKK